MSILFNSGVSVLSQRRQVFCFAASRRPGGIFLFDLLTEEAHKTLWGKSSAIVEEDNVCNIRGRYQSEAKSARTEITMFRLEDQWTRSDVSVRQRCHDLADILTVLESTGFSRIQSYNALRSLPMTGDLAVGRIFVRAVKESV
jgi:hypothetical protein